MKPSNFLSRPMGSILQNIESEIVARNIMVILNRTGNKFRPIEWNEYVDERLKDGSFTNGEQRFFDAVKKILRFWRICSEILQKLVQ